VKERARQASAVLAVAAVVAAVLGGLWLLGSPQAERERRLDARRVAELRAIAAAVDLYWTRQGRLPESLAELSQERGIEVAPLDPVTGRPYGYRMLGGNGYELCAEFALGAAERGHVPQGDFWSHAPGAQCFRLEPKAVEP
jgi:hypothetical protein